jgi:hypothetical protein
MFLSESFHQCAVAFKNQSKIVSNTESISKCSSVNVAQQFIPLAGDELDKPY